MRKGDLPARWGGEEFIIALPKTDLEGATGVAERLRKRVEDSELTFEEKRIAFTVSLGCSSFLEQDTRVQDAIDRADAALYESKNNGRNRLTSKGEPSQHDHQT